MITHCHLCKSPLVNKASHDDEGEYQEFSCKNSQCKGIKMTLSYFSFSISSGKIVHAFIPMIINNQMYSFFTMPQTTQIILHSQKFNSSSSGFPTLDDFEEIIIGEWQDLTELPLDFLPTVEKLILRYLNLKAFS